MLPLTKRAAAEGIGTALLLAIIVGSGIMGERLAGGNVAIALLANSIATGAGLIALILSFPDAHFNPLVTLSSPLPWREVPVYFVAQVVGAIGGVAMAHGMFGLAVFSMSHHDRAGQAWSESVATFGLLMVVRSKSPVAIGGFITAGYWFTASTCFANPAVTLARSLTDTFTGIRAADVAGFIGAQLIGALLATILLRWLYGARKAV